MTEKAYAEAGYAIYEHSHGEGEQTESFSQTIHWGPGYPPVDPPECPTCKVAYDQVAGDDPTEGLEVPLTEEEQIEAEAQAIIAAELAAVTSRERAAALAARVAELRAQSPELASDTSGPDAEPA